jgi:methylated-DNA-[protein]-cysteine S-methyltransferase
MTTPHPMTTPVVAALRPTPVDSATLSALHDRLVRAADDEGLLDVVYTIHPSPVGPLLLVATSGGLLRVAFEREDHDAVLSRIAGRVSSRILEAPDRLAEAAGQLDEYFAGRRRDFTLPLDRSLSSGFRREVQDHLRAIPYGHTETYTEVATLLGRPQAVRAVGSGCATNPLPLVLPCHRVLRSDGTLGGYAGGLAAKAALLELEAAA